MDRSEAPPETGGRGQTFDSLIAETERIREENTAYRRQLLQCNREMAAAAAIAEAISAGETNLAATLQRALQVVLEVTGLAAGWILLLPAEGREPVLVSSAGLPLTTAAGLARFQSPECECRQTVDSRQPQLVYPLHAGCPVHGLYLADGREAACHATVPLLAHSRVLGVLNLAGEDAAHFDVQELTLLRAIGRQLGVAIENAYLWDELRQRDALRSQLLEQALASQEDERKRIARELHDQVGQSLTWLLVWLRALEAEASGSAGLTVSPARLRELKAVVADTLDLVRELAVELRPTVLDDLGLVPALERYVHTCHDRHQLEIDFATVGLDGVRLPPPVETALYRIVQEALTNVVQHAGAACASLLLEARWVEPRSVVAIVEDNGCGFEVTPLMRAQRDDRWLGLSGMRERAELLGGRLTVESAPGVGTTVFVEMPL